MALNRIYKFSDINEAQAFLNGAIIGRDISKGGVRGLVGQVLTFSSPAFAVTFTAVSPAPINRDPYTLLILDIKQQIEAANGSILVQQLGGRIVFIERVPTSGVALAGNDEPAKAALGFDGNSPTVGKLFRPAGISGGPPNYTWAYSVNETTHVLFTWE
jgi:hypothetical protein